MRPRLLLFDIDGTLIRVQPGFTRSIIENVMRSHLIDPQHLDEISFAGRTDRFIFTEVIHKSIGSADERRFSSLKRDYIQAMDRKLTPEHIEILPGAHEILTYCRKEKIITGILSGNFRESAHIKLREAGLDGYFMFGAYGSLHTDRNHLPALALKAAETTFKKRFSSRESWIIGDTPYDVICAHSAGMKAVVLPTGPYSMEKLMAHTPDHILPSLHHLIQYLDESIH